MEAVARLRKSPISPRKMRLVADLIRGSRANKAFAILKHKPKKCAIYLEKLLLAAIANWQNKNKEAELEEADLYVKAISVDSAGILKRLRPAPQGRAHRIRKRSNHVTLVVDSLKNSELTNIKETNNVQNNETELTTDGTES